MTAAPTLAPAELAFLAAARTGALATMAADGRPRLVPICFVAVDAEGGVRLYSPLDDKPKRVSDPHALARVRDIAANPLVSLLVDRWSEDWSELGWLRIDGRAELIEPGDAVTSAEHGRATAALRDKYPQYATHRLEDRPIIRIAVERVRIWGNLDAGSI